MSLSWLPVRQNAHLYDPVIPDIDDWPIAKLDAKRDEFIDELVEITYKNMLNRSNEKGTSINSIIANAVYYERMRIKKDP